jgi:predicted nucleic acid-binding protein
VKDGFQGQAKCFVSNQVLAELFVVLTQKVAKPITKEEASRIVRSFAGSPQWRKLNYDCGTVSRAAMDAAMMKKHFWDVLIAETMRDSGIKRIYTENVGDFKGMGWVEAVNPIAVRSASRVR